MNQVSVACPHCRTNNVLPPNNVAKTARCYQCQQVFLLRIDPEPEITPVFPPQPEHPVAKPVPTPPPPEHPVATPVPAAPPPEYPVVTPLPATHQPAAFQPQINPPSQYPATVQPQPQPQHTPYYTPPAGTIPGNLQSPPAEQYPPAYQQPGVPGVAPIDILTGNPADQSRKRTRRRLIRPSKNRGVFLGLLLAAVIIIAVVITLKFSIQNYLEKTAPKGPNVRAIKSWE